VLRRGRRGSEAKDITEQRGEGVLRLYSQIQSKFKTQSDPVEYVPDALLSNLEVAVIPQDSLSRSPAQSQHLSVPFLRFRASIKPI
jgi:hypothetical protein